MDNPQIVSKTGVGTSNLQMLARDISPFAVSFACVVTGSATFTVEYTYDDPNTGPTGVTGEWPSQTKTPTWWPIAALTGKTANTDASLGTPTWGPVFGWRVNVTAGTGTVTVTATQAGMTGGV